MEAILDVVFYFCVFTFKHSSKQLEYLFSIFKNRISLLLGILKTPHIRAILIKMFWQLRLSLRPFWDTIYTLLGVATLSTR